MKHPIAPMLCGWIDAPEEGQPFVSAPDTTYEIKWDGYRLIAVKQGDEVSLYGRSGRYVTAEFPEVVESLRQLTIDVVLDGEIMVNRDGWPSFQDLQNRMSLSKARREADLRYTAYDVLSIGSLDTHNSPYSERRKALVELVKLAGPAVVTGPSSTDGAKMWAFVMNHKLEGLIAKKLNSRYQFNARNQEWAKIKRLVREDFVIAGYTTGEGKREGFFGAIIIAEPDPATGKLRLIGSVGTGFTDAVLADLKFKFDGLTLNGDAETYWPTIKEQGYTGKQYTWLKPELVATVQYPERSDAGTPKMAAFKGLVR